MTVLTLLTLLVSAGAMSGVQTASTELDNVLVYEANIQHNFLTWRNTRLSWIFDDRSVANEVLVDVDSDLRTYRVISNHELKPTEGQYETALDAWKNAREELKYLRLSCHSAGSRWQCHSQCFNDSGEEYDDAMENQTVSTRWNKTTCEESDGYLELKANLFANLTDLQVLELSNVDIVQSQDDDAFSGLSKVQFILLRNVRFNETGSSSGLFCSVHRSLVAINMINVTYEADVDSSGIFRQFSCNEKVFKSKAEFNRGNAAVLLNVTVLQLTDSGIRRLPNSSFSGFVSASMLLLNVSANRIDFIECGAFYGLENLLELDLSKNRLTHLLPSTLESLRAIRFLNLESNVMAAFSTDIFSVHPVMSVVDLADNQLSRIDGSFSVLPAIEFLILTNNSLTAVKETTFQNCTNLSVLKLNINSIRSVHPAALKGASSNTTCLFVDLSHNRLDSATELRQFLWGSGFLCSVNLKSNYLTEVIEDMFEKNARFTKLAEVFLTNNSITRIHEKAFSNLRNTSIISLDQNRLSDLSENVFQNATSLSMLNLEHNALPMLPFNIFRFSTNLTWLSVKNNILSSFDINTTRIPLRELHLEYNRLSALPMFKRTIRSLEHLYLQGNNFPNLTKVFFKQFPYVKTIDLDNCSSLYLENGALAKNSLLTKIILSNNHGLDYSSVTDYFSFSNTDPKYGLYLDNVGMTSAKDLFKRDLRFVRTLSISGNPINEFPDQPDFNLYEWIPMLRTIYCPELDRWIFSYSDIFGYSTVHNERIEVSVLNMSNCNLTKIDQNALHGAFALETFDLRNNQLREFHQLRIPSLHYKVLLDGNPIACTCQMKWLKEGAYATHYNLTNCTHALTNEMVKFSEVDKSEFLCRVTSTSCEPCSCFTDNPDPDEIDQATLMTCYGIGVTVFPAISQSVKIVNMSSNRLTAVTMVHGSYPKVQVLDFSSNNISRIESLAFSSFPELRHLILQANRLKVLQSGAFVGLHKLKRLYLDGNWIVLIEPNALAKLSLVSYLTLHDNFLKQLSNNTMDEIHAMRLKYLTLHNNPWDCLCDNVTFKRWIANRINITADKAREIRCNGSAILDIPDDDFLCYDHRKHIVDFMHGPLRTAIAIACFLFAIIVVAGLSYRNRHTLQVKLYNSRFRIYVKRPENENCAYDATIVYDSKNESMREWVQDELVARITKHDPTARIFEADDVLGGEEAHNVLSDKIIRSRRSIFVFDEQSSSFTTQAMCRMFSTAFNYSINEDKTHDILMIFTDQETVQSLLGRDDVELDLVAYVKHGKRGKFTKFGKYLMLPATDCFWEELFFFMPHMDDGVAYRKHDENGQDQQQQYLIRISQ